jgi:Tfp pilus assembly protein PilF
MLRISTRNCISISETIFMILVFLTTTMLAQKTAEIDSGMYGNEQIVGKVFLPPGDTSGTSAVIKLRGTSSPEVKGITDHEGNFRFTHLRTDTYTVIVDAGDAYEMVTEIVSVGFSGSVPAQGNLPSYVIPLVYPIQIYLKAKHSAIEAALDKVPAPVRDLFSQAVENARAGNHPKAIEQLRSVVSQAPEFLPAYKDLAAEYMKTGDAAAAVGVLRAAIMLDPNDPALRLSYGVALISEKKFEAAEAELMRVANQADNPDSPLAGYYLGVALVSENKTEAARTVFETVIKNGGSRIAGAHKYLGGIYWSNKQYREAASELEKYLKLEPKAADAEKIRGTIKELRHKS